MITKTVRHHFGDNLKKMLKGIAEAERWFTSGHEWGVFAQRIGLSIEAPEHVMRARNERASA